VRVTFRTKLLGLAGVYALAFLFILVASAVIAARVQGQLASIQHRYLPKVELEPQLERGLERVQHAFQDAVGARDMDALEATREPFDELLKQLDAAHDAVDPGDAAALRASAEDYFATAFDVSRRLIDGETGERLVDSMKVMQAKQARTQELAKQTAALDPAEISAAFAAATRAEASAGTYRLWVGLGCLAAVVLLSLGVSRGLLRSVGALTTGLARFGRGDFAVPIDVSSHDEIADLARHANEMAASLDRLSEDTRRAELALKASNKELEAFSYSVAHDLRTPLRGINGFSRVLIEDYGTKLDAEAHQYLARIGAATERMGELIDALLSLARVTRAELTREPVSLTRLADGVVRQLRATHPDREVDFVNEEEVVAHGDPALLRAVLENLLGNAWKFTGKTQDARITFGVERDSGVATYFVRDNGAGFDMAYAKKLFAPFQRLHTQGEFAGTGVGLATVQRIVHRHGGRIWAEGAVGRGATLRFTLTSTTQGATP
jgi:signal transduction histidine kinase